MSTLQNQFHCLCCCGSCSRSHCRCTTCISIYPGELNASQHWWSPILPGHWEEDLIRIGFIWTMKLGTKLLTAWEVLRSLDLVLSIDLLLLAVAMLTGVDEIFIIATILALPAKTLLSHRVITLRIGTTIVCEYMGVNWIFLNNGLLSFSPMKWRLYIFDRSNLWKLFSWWTTIHPHPLPMKLQFQNVWLNAWWSSPSGVDPPRKLWWRRRSSSLAHWPGTVKNKIILTDHYEVVFWIPTSTT